MITEVIEQLEKNIQGIKRLLPSIFLPPPSFHSVFEDSILFSPSQSHISYLEYDKQPWMTLNFSSSCLYSPSAGVTGISTTFSLWF